MCKKRHLVYILPLVFYFVRSGLLQVYYVPVSVFALHFSSSEIEGLHCLGKVAVTKQAILKACNETDHGQFEPPRCRQSEVTHCSNILAILPPPNIVPRNQVTAFCSLFPVKLSHVIILVEARSAVVVRISELKLSSRTAKISGLAKEIKAPGLIHRQA